MRYTTFVPLDRRVSALGFGCAPVGSRYGRQQSLRAMGIAFDAGVNYFDVARAYGYGDAEGIVGEFIRGKRDRVIVASKFGIDPPRSSRLRRLGKGVARRVFSIVPQLRKAAAPALGAQFVSRRFDATHMRGSVDTTLARLGVDRLDVLHIHDCTPEAAEDDTLFAALESLVDSGKVASIGATGERSTLLRIAARRPIVRVLQYRHDPLGDVAAPPPPGVATIVHHPFGGDAGLQQLTTALRRIKSDGAAPSDLRRTLSELPLDEAVAWLALSTARRANGASVVLTAMFSPRHIEANARASGRPELSDAEWAYLDLILERGAGVAIDATRAGR